MKIKGKIKTAIGIITDLYLSRYYELRWKILTHNNRFNGITNEMRNVEVVVSMTSYPARIGTVHLAIKSLMMQTTKANRIILWLAEQEFLGKEDDLPGELVNLRKYGLSIKWCDDIKSYKKLIPTLVHFSESVVITVDDDLLFPKNLIKNLYNEYLQRPYLIHCHRVTKFIPNKDGFGRIIGGFDYYKEPSYLNKLSGGAGCLFPPKALDPEVVKKESFIKLSPTNDDIWFWAMAVINGTRINVVKKNYPYLHYIKGTQENALFRVNDLGPRYFDIHLRNVMNAYPLFEQRLKDEARRNR